MTGVLRLAFLHGPAESIWRPGFDLAQAAAALDSPIELGFAGLGLDLILTPPAQTPAGYCRCFSSLEVLGVQAVFAHAAEPQHYVAHASALPVRWLDGSAWADWLRATTVQVW